MAMPADLRDGLSAEQREALDRTAMNGGRVVTDRELYDTLDDQAVSEPEKVRGHRSHAIPAVARATAITPA